MHNEPSPIINLIAPLLFLFCEKKEYIKRQTETKLALRTSVGKEASLRRLKQELTRPLSRSYTFELLIR